MQVNKVKGACLCGSVRFEIRPPLADFRYCYCQRCQKATGSAHAANAFVPASQFTWLAGDALIRHFDLPGAKRFAVSFCGKCGTRVPHKIRSRDDYLIPAGLLENDPLIRPQNSIFCGSKAPWYLEPREIPQFNEYP